MTVTRTVEGRVGSIYELRHVGKDNRAVLDFSIVYTPRVKDGDKWVDSENPIWTNVTVWGKMAENAEKSLRKGVQVFVSGRVEMKDGYTNKSGDEIPAREQLVADVVALSLRWDAAESEWQPRGNGGGERSKSSSARPSSASQRTAPKAAAKSAPKEDTSFDDDTFFDDGDAGDDDAPF